MVKVSVIVPVYNVEAYLPKCLDSILNQTLKEIEIICVEDCSTDNSLDILEQYQKKDKRISIIRHENNKGLGPARNTGINNASGEYIGFIDSDDFISLDFFEQLYSTAKKYDSDITNTLNIIYLYDEKDKKKINKFYSTKGKSNVNIENEKIGTFEYMFMTSWNKIYKKKFLIENNLFFMDIKSGPEDEDLYQRILLVNKRTSYNHKAVYYYRQRENSIVKNISKDLNNCINTVSLMLNSIDFCKKIKPQYLQHIYKRTFLIVLGRLDITIYKEEFYKYLYDFTMQINLEKDLFNDIIYAEYKIIKLNKDYNNYIIYKNLLDGISKYNYEKDQKVIKLINKLVWYIPARQLRNYIRNKMIKNILEK